MRTLIAFLLLCTLASAGLTDEMEALFPAAQATHKSVVFQGDWETPTTWQPPEVPPTGSQVLIQCNSVIKIHQNTNDIRWIRCDGVLTGCDHCDYKLSVHSIYVPMMGRFRFGMPDMPFTGKVTIEFVPGSAVGLTGPFLPGDWSKLSLGVLCHGEFMVCGADKSAWHNQTGTIDANSSQVVMTDLPWQWNVGDQILIAGTDSGSAGVITAANKYQSEIRSITAIDGRTITIDSPLTFKHFQWRDDLPYHIANLTRNVVIRSRDTSAIENRGHLMFMSSMNDIRYARIEGLGRTDKSQPVTDPRKDSTGAIVAGSTDNPRARYADHNHRTGPLNPPSRRKWNVVDGSPGWGLVNHASNAEWDNCIALHCYGSGFQTEEGQERGAIRRCLAALNRGLADTADRGLDGRKELGDYGIDGTGFWLQGGMVEVSDCVTFDNSGRGFMVFNIPLNNYPRYDGLQVVSWIHFPIVADKSLLTPEYAAGKWYASNAVPSGNVPLRVFARNTAYNCRTDLESWNTMFAVADGLPPTVWGSMTDVTLWGRGAGCIMEYTQQMKIDGLKIVGDMIFRDQFSSITKGSPGIYISQPNIHVTRYAPVGLVRTVVDVGTDADKPTHSIEMVN